MTGTRRAILLLAGMAAAVLVACSGVALAQRAEQQPPGSDNAQGGQQTPKAEVIPDQYIVVLKDKEDPKTVANEHASEHSIGVRHVYERVLNGYAANVPPQRLEALRNDERVSSIFEDTVEHKDAAPQTEKTAGKPSPSTNLQTMPSGILRIDADASVTAAIHPKEGDDPNVDIAILDTGIDGRHGDLNVAGGYNCTGRNTNAWGDRNGHGTHVAGTAAAKDNGSGVVGVAPGARLWAIKTLDGDGALSDHICGLDWITTQNSDSSTDNDIEVANYSGGGEGSDSANCGRDLTKGPDDPGYIVDPRHHATCSMVEAGVVFVASAGNIRRDLAEQQPATYNEVIAVTAIADYDGDWVLPKAPVPSGCTDQGDDDTAATFTNYAGKSDDHGHTIAAPGVCIRSTDKRGGYATASGTSMSSPHVAGTAALCIAGKQCVADPSEVMTNMAKLIGDAKTRNDTSAPYYGFAQAPSDPSDGAKYYGYLVTAKDY